MIQQEARKEKIRCRNQEKRVFLVRKVVLSFFQGIVSKMTFILLNPLTAGSVFQEKTRKGKLDVQRLVCVILSTLLFLDKKLHSL